MTKHALGAGVCRRRVEAGAISSPAKPQAEAESGWQGSHSALRNTNLFPVRLDKSAQVTPSLQKQARAKKAGQQNTDHAVSSLQPPLPPVTSQYDPVSYVEEGTIVPQPRPRSSVSRHTNSTDLVDNMRKAHISGPQARSEENDVEVLEHTGCGLLNSLFLCEFGKVWQNPVQGSLLMALETCSVGLQACFCRFSVDHDSSMAQAHRQVSAA